MLTLITSSGSIPLKTDDYYIRELASGLDELIFNISIWDDDYKLIQEESSIREESDGHACNYLVKAIDAGNESATIKAQIDLDEWKSTMTVGYDSGSTTFQIIVNAVKPTGWTVVNSSGIASVRTIRMDAATPFDVLDQCRNTFPGATFRFDNINKTVTLLSMNNGTNLGAFVTRDLNMKENSYKGKSTGFATRLYAYGKNGMTFESINGGKPYVEDFTYSDRVICAYWSDERYTIPQNLLADAQAKLAEMAIPQRSFDCSVVDLAKTNPEKYSELDFVLFSFVGLIDKTRSNTKINHQVVERWLYPKHPEQNKVVLSTVAPRIQSHVAQIIQSITNVNSDWSQKQAATFDALTAAILGANGGSVRLLDTDNDGEPDTLYIADDPDPAEAKKVWRFNYQGWAARTNGYNGPFSLGATVTDGGTIYANILKVLNINASNISTGTLDASRITVSNLNASNITSGTLSADRIAANSIAVAKLTGTITNSDWKLDLTNGTFTIGKISANNLTAGTINGNTITVTNLNATNITAGSLNVDRITNGSLTGGKIAQNTITGGSSGNIALGTITGGVNGYGTATGNLGVGSVSYGNTGFTGTLDQVGVNKSNIETIQGYFTGSANFNRLDVNVINFAGRFLTYGSIKDGNGNTVSGVVFGYSGE